MSRINRKEIKEMYGGRCAYCGCILGDKWHADHVEPVIRALEHGHLGDKVRLLKPENHRPDNYKPSCIPCNINKHSNSLEGWRRQLEGLPSALAKNSGQYRHAIRFGLVYEHRKPIVFYFEQYESTAPEVNP